MKKLFLFLFVAALFVACSSDDTDDTTPQLDGKKYKVTFNVENFELETSPLKDAGTHSNYFSSYIYNKETGKAVYTSTHQSDSVSVNLKAGSYYFVSVSKPTTIPNSYPGNSETSDENGISGYNFDTDYLQGAGWLNTHPERNLYVYYGKQEFTVGENSENAINETVTLMPTWSEVIIDVTDAATCDVPEGTTNITCQVSPYYYGVNIADGKATKTIEDSSDPSQSSSALNLSWFRDKSRTFKKYIADSKDISVKIVFWELTPSSTRIVGERVIYKGDLDKGKKITLSGALGRSLNETASFTPVLGELTDGGVIPFNQ